MSGERERVSSVGGVADPLSVAAFEEAAVPFEREELTTPDGRRLLLYGSGRTDSSRDGGSER
jgi:hypothetical protein